MRYYQVSDQNNDYSLIEYTKSRFVTTFAMIITTVAVIYVVAYKSNYSIRKTIIVYLVCFYRIPEAFEDVFQGNLQQNGRMDIASKSLAIRMIISLASYGFSLIVFKDQLIAIAITLATTAISVIWLLWIVKDEYVIKTYAGLRGWNIVQLLKNCFPLFFGGFISIYVTNAPKYSIDLLLGDSQQAVYGFIAMPVSAIGLLSGFIFSPSVYSLSVEWKNNKKTFYRKIVFQMMAVIAITVGSILLAWFCGIQVLSFLFNTELDGYRNDLLILLLGGGFSALSALLGIYITIIRKQKWLSVGYIITALAALLISNRVVLSYGVRGASFLYLGLMFILSLVFFVMLINGLENIE